MDITQNEQNAWHAGIDAGREIERNNAAVVQVPSDDELFVIHDQFFPTMLMGHQNYLNFARTLLAKYGAQPANSAQDREDVINRAITAMELARSSHGVTLLSDPPKDAWIHRGVDSILVSAINAARKAKWG